MPSSQNKLLYRVCEAKFVAEQAPGVGRETVVAHFKPPKSGDGIADDKFVRAEDVSKIRKGWEKERKRQLPKATLFALDEALGMALEPLRIIQDVENTMRSGGDLNVGFVNAVIPDEVKKIMHENSKVLEEITKKSLC